MPSALIPEVKPKPQDAKGVRYVMGQKLETCLLLFDRAVSFLKSGDYQKAGFMALAASAIAGRHYKARPRDATQVLMVSEGILRAAVAHAELPPAVGFLAKWPARCEGDEVFPCLGATRAARSWISKKIRILIHEGYQPRQAARIAYEMARRRGYHVPAPLGCPED